MKISPLTLIVLILLGCQKPSSSGASEPQCNLGIDSLNCSPLDAAPGVWVSGVSTTEEGKSQSLKKLLSFGQVNQGSGPFVLVIMETLAGETQYLSRSQGEVSFINEAAPGQSVEVESGKVILPSGKITFSVTSSSCDVLKNFKRSYSYNRIGELLEIFPADEIRRVPGDLGTMIESLVKMGVVRAAQFFSEDPFLMMIAAAKDANEETLLRKVTEAESAQTLGCARERLTGPTAL
jgi:hypothetical protein